MWSTPSRLREPSTDSMICGVSGGFVSSLGLGLGLGLKLGLRPSTDSMICGVGDAGGTLTLGGIPTLSLSLSLALALALALALTLT